MRDASETHFGCGGVVDRFGAEGAVGVLALALSEKHRNR
jgi:hypothetical protein